MQSKVQISNAQIKFSNVINNADIRDLFVIKDPKVLTFIGSNLGLINLLTEANQQIRKWFPSEELRLDFSDNSGVSAWIKLELCILTTLHEDEAFLRFDQFNEKWWFSCLDEAAKDLFIVLKFKNQNVA
jgi:hypothetical protein